MDLRGPKHCRADKILWINSIIQERCVCSWSTYTNYLWFSTFFPVVFFQIFFLTFCLYLCTSIHTNSLSFLLLTQLSPRYSATLTYLIQALPFTIFRLTSTLHTPPQIVVNKQWIYNRVWQYFTLYNSHRSTSSMGGNHTNLFIRASS
jgi:hypothetical protein